MAQEIRIPKLGLTMTEATLVNWLAGAGQPVAREQIICVIETDTVSMEMPAPAAGVLCPIVEAGRRVEVGELIGYVAADQAEYETVRARHAVVETQPAEAEAKPISEPERTPAAEKPRQRPPTPTPTPTQAKTPGDGQRIVASPAARKLGRELGIELKGIAGSGPDGRIVLADVQKAAQDGGQARVDAQYDFGLVAQENEMLSVAEEIPIRGIRKIIFKNMKLSISSQAQLTVHTEASAEAMRATRALFNARLQEGQPKVSYNAVIIKTVAHCLRAYPVLNAVVAGRHIRIWRQIHIGVAMDFGQGLIVPKVRNADTKSLPTISGELDDLAARGAKKKLLPDELQAGTFTVTNLGSWDIDEFTPICNFPESAILGVGRIVEKPWVRNGAVVAEPRVTLSLTFDHRVIDGALAAEFLKNLKDRLEDPRLML